MTSMMPSRPTERNFKNTLICLAVLGVTLAILLSVWWFSDRHQASMYCKDTHHASLYNLCMRDQGYAP